MSTEALYKTVLREQKLASTPLKDSVWVMKASQTTAANPEIAASLSPIDSNAEGESFRATYDRARDPTSLAVIAAVSTALGEDPRTLTPLQAAIDTDALDALTRESATGLGAWDSISFRYGGFEITVTSEDVIEANPIQDT